MNPIDYHKSKLKELHTEMSSLNKRKKLIEKLIKDQVKIIDDLIEPVIKKQTDNNIAILRDVNLCTDFIIKNKRVTSRQLIDFLNQELDGQYVRWKNKLDGNQFMSYMGSKLLELKNIKKTTDENNKKLNYWEFF